jgi:hypothetical protein
MTSFAREAANPPYKLPPPIFGARCRACWFTAALLVLVVASFVSLNLDWAAFASVEAARSMGRFASVSSRLQLPLLVACRRSTRVRMHGAHIHGSL